MEQHIEQADEKRIESVNPFFKKVGEVGERSVKREQLFSTDRVNALEKRENAPLEHRIVEDDTVVIESETVAEGVGVDKKSDSCNQQTVQLLPGNYLGHVIDTRSRSWVAAKCMNCCTIGSTAFVVKNYPT